MGLMVNQRKTKYMVVSSSQATRERFGLQIAVGDCNFEEVRLFSYLGSLISITNNVEEEDLFY